jgi:hypothetical protein
LANAVELGKTGCKSIHRQFVKLAMTHDSMLARIASDADEDPQNLRRAIRAAYIPGPWSRQPQN